MVKTRDCFYYVVLLLNPVMQPSFNLTPQTQQLHLHGVFDELGKSVVPLHATRCFPSQYGCYIILYVYLYSFKQSAWADAQRVSTSPFLCEFGSIASEKGEGNSKIGLKKQYTSQKSSRWTRNERLNEIPAATLGVFHLSSCTLPATYFVSSL